ncbi:hypothetical protein [Phenylobacterium sp.]|uniref:hypothetical protein n=1 Tax=Phenylobacterium sp. TaxID=1871053 RepID=UPI002810D3B8|nr:hypothetical protein [Phenylobacterium sp.]
MSSAVSRGKLDKMLSQDLSVQASIRDVLKNSRLVEAAAIDAGVDPSRISAVCCRALSSSASEKWTWRRCYVHSK